MNNGSSIKLMSGNSHPEMAKLVSDRLGIPLTPCTVKKFSDNETSVQIGESVRDQDVYIFQTGFNPSIEGSASMFNDPNDLIMELLILISACKTASAKRITAVIPCFPYARMDRKDKSRGPITAKLIANMLQIAGCDHVITVDLHASQIQGFFDFPVDNLWTEPSMCRWIKENVPDWKECVIVSPDAGGAKRATAISDRLDVNFALINRNRTKGDAPDSDGRMELLVGDVRDKNVILIDDMCDTGETIRLATMTLVDSGARAVYAAVSHGLLSGDATSILTSLPLSKLVVTNTVSQTEHLKIDNGKLAVVDISSVIAESIRRTHNGESISLLFTEGFTGSFN